MKKLTLFTLIALLVLATTAQAQSAMSLETAKEKGLKITVMDSLYKSGIHDDPSKAVFAQEQSAYISAYFNMLKEINSYLNTHNFRWGNFTRCFNRIYFNEDGSIEYFIYDFDEGNMTDAKRQEFEKLLNMFVAKYKFPLSKNMKFAQCGATNFKDVL